MEDIQHILAAARKNNAELGVTGLLCFNRRYFLQCLEGGREAVNTIYHRISNDTRHKKILLLSYDNIQECEFSEWAIFLNPACRHRLILSTRAQQFSTQQTCRAKAAINFCWNSAIKCLFYNAV